MVDLPDPVTGQVDTVLWEARPEWLAEHLWWRVYVARRPKVLVRYLEFAVAAAKVLSADEQRLRHEAAPTEE